MLRKTNISSLVTLICCIYIYTTYVTYSNVLKHGEKYRKNNENQYLYCPGKNYNYFCRFNISATNSIIVSINSINTFEV